MRKNITTITHHRGTSPATSHEAAGLICFWSHSGQREKSKKRGFASQQIPCSDHKKIKSIKIHFSLKAYHKVFVLSTPWMALATSPSRLPSHMPSSSMLSFYQENTLNRKHSQIPCPTMKRKNRYRQM